MSDSDTDVFSNNVYAHRNQSMRICAKGPNTNTTSFSVQNKNMFTTTMNNMHWNMDRPRYATSVYDQRTMYSRRETSPMSLHSASGVHSRNLHNSYYPGGMSCQRSMYNGRSGSPMSVRTIDSNTSAIDIALALKTKHFNKSDMQIIKEAYNKFIKSRVRRRVEKRRNLRTFLKGCRRKSGGESGDQASDSSISSDDHRSLRSSRTATFIDCRSSRLNLMHLRKTMKESEMYRDCTDHLRQNRYPNMLSVPPLNMQEDLQPRLNNTSLMSKNARFTHGFLLPSQRFNANQTVASLTIPEMPRLGPQTNISQITNRTQNVNLSNFNQKRYHQRESSQEAISEQDEIFSEITMMHRNNETRPQRKRGLEEEDITHFGRKKNKLSTPVKKIVNPSTLKPKQAATKSNNKDNGNGFEFAKPQLPVKKPANVTNLNMKPQQVCIGTSKALKTSGTFSSKTQTLQTVSNQERETVISQSQLPMEETISQTQNTNKTVVYQSPEKIISKSSQPLDLDQQRTLNLPQNNDEKDKHEMTYSTTEVSMRPSFIKRKLFTQKVDENENSESSESSRTQSPQNIYSKIQKEKNKARKLVTQSCLSRDLGDESNLLDLIHKIVPPDRMNLTTAPNKSEIQIKKSKPANSDKWNITEIITTNKGDELSETFTDDEIFQNDEAQQNHAYNKQNCIKDNNKKNVKKKQAVNDKDTLKTINKQSKPLKTKKQNLANNNSNKVLQKNSEKTETNKKTDTNTLTKTCPEMLSSPKVVLQKMSRHILKQTENVNNPQPNNEPTSYMETNDFNKKAYSVKFFWDETDSDNTATPMKNPQRKVLTNSPAVNHSDYNRRNNTQTEISQVVTAKAITTLQTNMPARSPKLKNNKLSHDAPKKGKVQSKEKTVKKLEVKKNVKVQPSTVKTLTNVLKCKQNNTETNKKEHAIPTLIDTKASKSRKEAKNLKINDNSLQVRALKVPKVNKACAADKFNGTVSNSTFNESQLCRTLRSTLNESQLCRTLRSRVIDLSTSLDKESSPLNKKTTLKNKQKRAKNKNVTKFSDKENISNTSDQSFTLSSKTPVASKLAANKRVRKVNSVKPNVTESRQSDVSFTLGETVLERGSLKFFDSSKKSPLSKRVVSTRLNQSRSSARLNRRKVY